jgi:predicted GIY-YIG superfamily endonuclease
MVGASDCKHLSRNPNMHFVYILKCFDKSYYVGLTSNLKPRMIYHNKGLSFSTSYRLPVRLKWFCAFPNKHQAALFEKYLKTGSGNAFFKKRLVSRSGLAYRSLGTPSLKLRCTSK